MDLSQNDYDFVNSRLPPLFIWLRRRVPSLRRCDILKSTPLIDAWARPR